MRRLLVALLSVTLCVVIGHAQMIVGPSPVQVGLVSQYTFSPNGSMPAALLWRLSDGGDLTPTTGSPATIQWTLPGTYTVAVFDQQHTTQPLAQLTVTVTSTPVTPITSFSFTYVCGTTTITRSSDPLAAILWYWQSDANGTSTANSSSSFAVGSPGTYYLRPRYGTNWGTAASVVATVETTFAAPATSTDGQVISDAPAAVPLSVAPVGGATSYLWYTDVSGGASIAGVTTNSYSPAVSATQTFYVAASNGICVSDRKSVTAFVYPEPIVTVTNGGTIPKGGSVTLSVANFPYATYQWRLNDIAINGAVNSSLTTTNSGNYTVVVTYGTAVKTSKVLRIYKGLEGQNMNFIVSNTVRVEGVVDKDVVGSLDVNQLEQSTQYFDDLGRPIQTVVTQGSPALADIVQPIAYDAYGREPIKYLPYVSSEENGRFKANPLGTEATYTTSEQYLFYSHPNSEVASDLPYAKTVFEPSPLDRVKKQGAAGAAGQPTLDPNDLQDHSIKKAYSFNEPEEVLAFDYDADTDNLSVSDADGLIYYQPNMLYKNRSIDENNHDVLEYVDKQGRTICKKVQATEAPNAFYACTYYIYDDEDQLILVLPPEAIVEILKQH